MNFSTRIEKINNKILKCQEEIEYLKKQLENYNKMIAKYSKFQPDILYNSILDVMSAYEKKEFCLQDYNIDDIYVKAIIASNVINQDSKITLTRLLDLMLDKLAYFLTNRKKIVLDENGYLDIYTCSNSYETLNTNIIIKDDKFPYIEEFIDYIITYKIEKDIIILSDEELINLKNQFIESRQNEIIEYHKSNKTYIKKENKNDFVCGYRKK